MFGTEVKAVTLFLSDLASRVWRHAPTSYSIELGVNERHGDELNYINSEPSLAYVPFILQEGEYVTSLIISPPQDNCFVNIDSY